MSWVNPGQAEVMKVDVAVTSGKGHPPEFWAHRCVEHLIKVSENAPPEIRQQALAFRDQMEQVILFHVKRAIESDRTTIQNVVSEAGQPQLAELLRRV